MGLAAGTSVPSRLLSCSPHLGAGAKAWLLIWWPCSPVPVTAQTLTGVPLQGTNAACSGSAEGRVLQAMPCSSFSSASTWRPNTALESKATQKMTSPLVRKQLCGVFAMLNLCNPHHPNFWASARHTSYKSICTVFWEVLQSTCRQSQLSSQKY